MPPTPTPTIEPTPTTAPTQTPAQAGSVQTIQTVANTSSRPISFRLGGLRYTVQSWNNCGPANTTMALSYYGWQEDQDVAASFLKPNKLDKNVSPYEIANFINTQTGVRALVRIGGNTEVLRELIAAGFPVIIESGLMPEAYEWIGHYRTVVGYDDAQGIFVLFDSFLGEEFGEAGYIETISQVDSLWRHFNRTFIVVYQQTDESRLMNILGNLAEEDSAAEMAFNTAQEEARANPQDGFAWFNMGSALVELERYEEAAAAFDRAWQIGVPWRMLWYQFGPFEAYFNVGRYQDVLSFTNVNLNNGGDNVEETHYWRGRVFEAQGEINQAISAYREALRHNPKYTPASEALDRLNS
ncbi:MAG: tetratricopeptide repeat protein [Chloroflexi bacterium]|nr:MAG: tetratricopeptide repeat protein [Chloroflexota bacterium]